MDRVPHRMRTNQESVGKNIPSVSSPRFAAGGDRFRPGYRLSPGDIHSSPSRRRKVPASFDHAFEISKRVEIAPDENAGANVGMSSPIL
jgi:hypothetical protein